MRIIRDKIKEERNKAMKLSGLAIDQNYDDNIRLRQEQDKHYKKAEFFKKLNNVIEKEKKNGKM